METKLSMIGAKLFIGIDELPIIAAELLIRGAERPTSPTLPMIEGAIRRRGRTKQ